MTCPIPRGVVDVTVNIKDIIVQTFSLIGEKIAAVAKTIFSFAKDTVWPLIKSGASHTWTFLRAPAGLITVGGSLVAFLAYASTTVNGDEQKWLKTGLQVAALAVAVGTGITIGLGISGGFTAVLF